ncbi:pullulanase-type alpha-1,6-glucosidase [Ornithinimicrobium sp. LYQ103]|uniref:pullulanase-type alpha-1,6-glucosidase n=1 Tax=Ornithinimicrobium sp. LYQ103 TaxID=3378796 RepID=UPI0038541B21
MTYRPHPGPRTIDLAQARAHWLTRDLLALPAADLPHDLPVHDLTWRLESAPLGGLGVHDEPGAGHALVHDEHGLPSDVLARVPHLAGCLALRLGTVGSAEAEELLRGQLGLVVRDHSGGPHEGRVLLATSVQVPHVLDDLYAERAVQRGYGVGWHGAPGTDGRTPTVTVWAPTALAVDLLLWDGTPPDGGTAAWAPPGEPARHPMTRSDDGAWSVTGDPGWRDRCYLLELRHVLPRGGGVRAVRSTDPWSVGLTTDSTHSVLVDLQDPAWAPGVWSGTPVPAPVRPVDQTIYELHVRDFSREDPDVPAELRGSYRAFGVEGHGRRHLRRLAEAGMTTVHLLPVFDLTSVEEDPARQRQADLAVLEELSRQDPAGQEQQRLVRAHALRDAFNWGYDPWHFLTPEGSYASSARDAHGGERVAQCREMVGALHGLGLRVVLDQVYNHTTDSGLARASVLDRVAPGYYHRLDADGHVETSTCCQNLATEHRMAEKLMVDGCVLWVRHYRVDGFRFDLMGHHSRGNLEAVRSALDALTPARDGVDGSAVTLYGEGWNFGEVADDRRFHQAVQGQLDGLGIGTFNDRIRDAVRGGAVHDDDPRAGLGFATGGADPHDTDLLQIGLAGGLRKLRLVSQKTGREVLGRTVRYGGAPAGYAWSPEEVVNYVDAHDNETLWDTLVLKLPRVTTMDERVRRNTLALATVTLSQGISFWHAGAELLRSKSLDRNSYASGDWFNHLDYTLRHNGFGRGLPPEPDNGRRWPLMATLLADPSLVPGPDDIARACDAALDLLRVRRDLPLLRLGTTERVLGAVSFPVSGTAVGRPDLVVMLVDGTAGERVDPRTSGVLVVLNGAVEGATVPVPGLAGQRWVLSAAQQDGADDVVLQTAWEPATGTVRVPGITAAVLVRTDG